MFEPSEYQKRIFNWFQKPDGPIAINAVAGSGKTTSLVMGFQQLRSPGSQLFAAFNASIVAELKKRLPSTVTCQTIHSLGYATLRKAFPDAKWDLENGNVKYRKMARDIEVDRSQFSDPKAIQDCVLSFLNYAQLTLTPLEVEPLMAMADRFGIEIPSGVTAEKVASTVKSMLEIGLEQGRKGLISFSDMLWMPATLGLNPPKYSLVAVDEAQDMNRAQMALVMRAMDAGGNFVSVGDPRQAIYCQPSGTMVLVGSRADGGQHTTKYEEVPIETIRKGDTVVAYAREDAAFYKGKKVLKVGTRSYTGDLIQVATDEGLKTECTDNHRWIVRWTDRSADLNVTYLMKQGNRYRVGWCQLFSKTEDGYGSFHLGVRTRLEKADCAWILGIHADKTSASIAESMIALRYGIPTIPFQPVNGAQHLTENAINRFFDSIADINLSKNATRCLEAFGRRMEWPFYEVDNTKRGRTTLFETRACNLISGLMKVPIWTGDTHKADWQTIRIDRRPVVELPVYSLEVDKYHTYIANGIVTGNCFAGAEADSFDQIKNYFGANELPLTFCYRCPESVILEAQKIVPQIECPPGTKPGIVDTITEEQFDKMLAPGDMVVCRLTAPLVKLCFDLIKRRIPAKVKGRDIGATIGNVVKQIMKREMDMSKFPGLMYKWQENQLGMLREKLGSEDQQESVNDRVAVLEICYAMFSPNSPNGFVEDIKSLFNDDQSPITLCTVHRAKGLENDRVFIIRPDKLPLVRKNQTQAQFDQEMNLKYVAITRAKNELYYVTPDPSTAEDNNRYRNPGIPGLTL